MKYVIRILYQFAYYNKQLQTNKRNSFRPKKKTNATVSEINRGWRGVSSAKRIHPPISLWALQVYNFKDKLHCL